MNVILRCLYLGFVIYALCLCVQESRHGQPAAAVLEVTLWPSTHVGLWMWSKLSKLGTLAFFFFFPTIFAYLAYIVSTWWSQEASTVNTACTCMCLNSQSVYLPDRAGRLLWQGVSHTYAQLFNSLGLSGGSFHFVFCNTCPSVEGRIYRLQKMSEF